MSHYPEQQSGVTLGVVEPRQMTLTDALAVMLCSQIRGHRRHNDLKRAASAVIDAHAAAIVAEWPDQG